MLLDVGRLPIIVRTLRIFQDAPVDGVVLAVPSTQVDEFRELCRQYELDKVRWVVEGGLERQNSIANALAALPARPEDWVAIHDGARPFLTQEVLERLFRAGPSFDGVLPMVPVKDTIKRVGSDGHVLETLARSELYAAQTPQFFRYGTIMEAHHQAARDGFLGTDDCALVERQQGRIGMVLGDYRNIKVTTPEDVAVAAAWVDLP
jgi:2-C-methyl-D-erythritol 4-phosphate cytidylyltransferase